MQRVHKMQQMHKNATDATDAKPKSKAEDAKPKSRAEDARTSKARSIKFAA